MDGLITNKDLALSEVIKSILPKSDNAYKSRGQMREDFYKNLIDIYNNTDFLGCLRLLLWFPSA